jgi:hypothetical protein
MEALKARQSGETETSHKVIKVAEAEVDSD